MNDNNNDNNSNNINDTNSNNPMDPSKLDGLIEEVLGEKFQEIMAESRELDKTMDEISKSVNNIVKYLKDDELIDQLISDEFDEMSDDREHVKKAATTWQPENAESIDDGDYMDKHVPAYDKDRQEYLRDVSDRQLGLLRKIIHRNPSVDDRVFDTIHKLDKDQKKLREDLEEHWGKRNAHHELEIERTKNSKKSLIDDYADPNLEQPSYMDPDD